MDAPSNSTTVNRLPSMTMAAVAASCPGD
jgi:hypothetical protein